MTDFSKAVSGAGQDPSITGQDAATTTVKLGDDLSRIADRLGVSSDDLQNANPHVDLRRLQPGMALNIPQGPSANAQGGPLQNRSSQGKLAENAMGAAQMKALLQPRQVAQAGPPPPATPVATSPAYQETSYYTPKGESAFFQKVETLNPNAEYTGISGNAVLPDVRIDPKRARKDLSLDPANDRQKPMDSPDVYMGGTVNNKEVDAGLTWDRVYTPKGEPTWTTDSKGWSKPPTSDTYVKDSSGHWQQLTLNDDGTESGRQPVPDEKIAQLNLQPNCAFRPYIRTNNVPGSASKEEKKKDWNTPLFKDVLTKTKLDGTTEDVMADATEEKPHNQYFYPGDEVKMSFGVVPGDSTATDADHSANVCLTVTSAPGKEGIPAKNFSMTVSQKGWADGARSFKRVNAIDTSGGGGAPVPTDTQATGGRWNDVKILKSGGKDPEPLKPADARQIRDSQSHDYYSHRDRDGKVRDYENRQSKDDVFHEHKYQFDDVFTVKPDPADPTGESVDIKPPAPTQPNR